LPAGDQQQANKTHRVADVSNRNLNIDTQPVQLFLQVSADRSILLPPASSKRLEAHAATKCRSRAAGLRSDMPALNLGSFCNRATAADIIIIIIKLPN
jgi:hypothetical protein